MNANKIIRGSFGKLFVNGVRYANINSFELKATMNYTEVNINGDLCTQNVYTGYSLAGTMNLHKISSYNANLVREGMKSGVMPSIKFVATVDDPNSNGADTIEVENVTFDEVTLMAFTNGEVGTEDIPFKAGGFNYIDINTDI